jgi:hypothetical protein
MRAWLWQVWPRPVWLLTALVAHAAWVGGVIFLLSRGTYFNWQDIRGVFITTPPGVPLLAAVVYAAFRVWAFHPALRPAYRAWLRQTPWSHRQPLPYGPVHLVAQDAILLGLAVAITVPFYGDAVAVVFILRAFAIVYLLCLLGALLITYEWAAAYGVLFGMAIFIHVWREGWYFFAAAAATYLVALAGLRRSYARFPWQMDISTIETGGQERPPGKAAAQPLYGWPFDLLSPSAGFANPPFWHSAACCLLAGWWLFAVLSADAVVRHDWNYVSGVYPTVFITCFIAMIRLGVYRCFEYLPPISLAGRLASGQWIIPGYDQVFLAPACGLAVAIGLPNALLDLGTNCVATNSLALPVALLTVVALPPRRRRWLLTGAHRIVPGFLGARPQQWV